jgi:inorganic phosphate transporter, PiT family
MVDRVAVGRADAAKRPRLEVQRNILAIFLFLAVLAVGILYAIYSLQSDIAQSGMPIITWVPFLLLGWPC